MTLIPADQTPFSTLTGNQKGTNDRLTTTDLDSPLFGDAFYFFDNAMGGNDRLTAASDGGYHRMFGEAFSIRDNTRGGNDRLLGGDGILDGAVLTLTQNYLYGDAYDIYANARAGNDRLIGGSHAWNALQGDSEYLSDWARGGNDVLIGGTAAYNVLYGDAASDMNGDARGGNDLLIAGDESPWNLLVGDAKNMWGNSICGKDRLISGTGDDLMYGDAQTLFSATIKTAADVFVFAPSNGADTIYDFRHSDGDRIDVRAFGYHGLADLTVSGGNVIDFGGGNSVTLAGLTTALVASDFIFA